MYILFSSKNLAVISVKALRVFALNPLGGSFVTLTLFCRTLTGKCLAGIDDKNSLKSS